MAEGPPRGNPAENARRQRRGANRAEPSPADSHAGAKHDAHHGPGAFDKGKGFLGVTFLDFLGSEVIGDAHAGGSIFDDVKNAVKGGGGHGKGHGGGHGKSGGHGKDKGHGDKHGDGHDKKGGGKGGH